MVAFIINLKIIKSYYIGHTIFFFFDKFIIQKPVYCTCNDNNMMYVQSWPLEDYTRSNFSV